MRAACEDTPSARAWLADTLVDLEPVIVGRPADVVDALRSGDCQRGLVAVDGPDAGQAVLTWRLLSQSDVSIVGERTGASRVLLLANGPVEASCGRLCITSLVFTTRDVPAALFKALGSFASNGINLIALQSGLSSRTEAGAASFYVEIEGSPDDVDVGLALDELAFFSRDYRVLGVYPADPNRGLRTAARAPRSRDLAAAPEAPGAPSTETLARLRHSIDNIDAAVIHLLAERFKVTREVGALKAQSGLPASDPLREARQLERLRRLAAAAHLDPEFATKFLAFVVAEVIHHHEALQRSRSDDHA